MADDDFKLIAAPEVMALTGLSKSTLFYLVEKGMFLSPTVRLGRHCRWERSALIRWIRSGGMNRSAKGNEVAA